MKRRGKSKKGGLTISGGDKIAGAIMMAKRKFRRAPRLLVGVPKAAGNYEDGVHTATIAAVQEFGSADGRIPERSFLRAGVYESAPLITKTYRKFMPAVVEGNMEIADIQNIVGEMVVGNIVEKISSGIPPANAESTKQKKGSSTPLIDTGHLRQSITYVLDTGAAESEDS